MFEERYRAIAAAVDAEFARNRELHGDRIRCRPGCTDCCSHIFEISEYEAERVREGVARLAPDLREAVQLRAREYVANYLVRGTPQPCPALENAECSIYEFRPLLCRKFGMPLYNPEKPDRIYACPLNFGDREQIDDPDLVQIQTAIHRDWKDLQAEYESTHPGASAARQTVAQAILNAGAGQQA